jgi:ribosomal protein L24E
MAWLSTVVVPASDAEKPSVEAPVDIEDCKDALAEFNALIGRWRGVGMPKRGSSRGAWFEKGEWIWSFEKSGVAIVLDVKKGKLIRSATLTFEPTQERYLLDVQYPDTTKRKFLGQLVGDKLVLNSDADAKGRRHRITVRLLNRKRTLMLYESAREGASRYRRVAEVGYTREGTRLAIAGSNGPECVVTGGAGTMEVVHKGKTYYVCCSGCRQAFEDDPEGVIAAYKKRRAAKKAKIDANR